MRLIKSHGLGNDYLVLTTGEPLDAAGARRLCDRHRGIGADGVLEPVISERADFGLRIWNPDGSQAEKSGNGLRIFARFLVDHRGAPLEFTIEVPSGVSRCAVTEDGMVRVEMGRAVFSPADVPCTRPLDREPVLVAGRSLEITAVGMGNPHCVAFFPVGIDLDALPWPTWGAALEVSPLFPNRTNVQFAVVLDRRRIALRIFERGAGVTEASGSSACAAAAAAFRQGWVDARVNMEMPGGTLEVGVGEDFSIWQRGPVEEIAEVVVRRAWLDV